MQNHLPRNNVGRLSLDREVSADENAALSTAAWELLGAPRLDSLSEMLHENTKIRPNATGFVISAETVQIMSQGFKVYELARVVRLPEASTEVTMPLCDAIRNRRSVRDFGDGSITDAQLSTLLFLANGQGSANLRRTTPSAGGLYPLELYPVLLKPTESVGTGVYHYNVRTASLEEVPAAMPPEFVRESIFVPEVSATASLILVITAVFGRTKIKYGERGYRFALLEAGHMAENALLTAVAMELGACAIGGFVDEYVAQLLDVDGVDEAPVYLVAIGPVGEQRR